MFEKFLKNHFCIVLFALLFFLISIASSLKESLTYDEIVHIQEGRNAWLKQQFVIDTNNPPFIRELQTLPLILHANSFLLSQKPNIQMLPGRMVTVALGTFLLVLVMRCVQKYVGKKEAIFAGLLFLFEPNILANSHYITQDIGVTLLYFIAYVLFLEMFKQFLWKKFFLFSVVVGLGMAAKITIIPYFLLSTLVFLLYRKRSQFLQELWQKKSMIIFSLLIAFSVIWATYFFKTNVIVQSRQDSTRVSAKLLAYANQNHNTFLKSLVYMSEHQQIPLGDYIGTLKNNFLRSTVASSCFFLGKIVRCQWYFMPVNLFLKVPLPLFIFFITSLIIFLKQKKKKDIYILLLIPLLSVLGVSMLFKMSPWIRYILPLSPFLIICAAFALPFWLQTKTRKIIFSLLLLWYIAGSLLSFPHFISYANELTLGQKTYLFTDSNMDWGQSLPDVGKFVALHPGAKIQFSYFGRDNADLYGLQSNLPYGSWKNDVICRFHTLKISQGKSKKNMFLISVSNWQYCGYNKNPQFARKKVKQIVGGSVLVF